MRAESWGTLAASLAALVGTVLTFRTSAKANRLSERKVDTEEFDAQLRRYRELLDQMQEQVDRLARLLREEQGVSDQLRKQVRDLETQQDALQREYTSLLRSYNESTVPQSSSPTNRPPAR